MEWLTRRPSSQACPPTGAGNRLIHKVSIVTHSVEPGVSRCTGREASADPVAVTTRPFAANTPDYLDHAGLVVPLSPVL